jgi:serine/threonine-protein kinase
VSLPDRLASALSRSYRPERELGQGGMAPVYLARDLKHDRQMAIKVLKPELAAVLGAERFVQEITTTAALQHPHILPLFDSGSVCGPDKSGPYMDYVMPFIDGETLRSKLDRETQVGIEEAVRITTDVASALHYAHTQGVRPRGHAVPGAAARCAAADPTLQRGPAALPGPRGRDGPTADPDDARWEVLGVRRG